VLGEGRLDTPIFGTAAEALARGCDVLVDYTSADAAKANVLAALDHGAHVVVGSSGLTDQDYAEIDAVARERQRGVLRQLRAHDGAAAEVRGAGREVPPELGDHRLRV
jgi:4-hydroxy-tetrahydrodipicolinate reductase